MWFVVYPGVQPLDVVGPHEVFGTANRVADGLGRPGLRYRTRLVTAPDPGTTGDGGPVTITTESGLDLVAQPVTGAEDRSAGDDPGPGPTTLVVPGGDGVRDAARHGPTVDLVARSGRAAERVASVCTGAFLAAAAGLLDGRRVATHWAWARQLATAHPEVSVDADAIHRCDDGVWSSAGVTAGIDLALAIVEQDLDPEVAQVVARWLVVYLRRPGGQSQFAAPIWEPASPLDPIRRAQELIHSEPGAELSVAAVAAQVGLSTRHLTRLFTAELGETPARFVERVRVDRARHRLETSSADLATIARSCGFGTAETLRRAFHRRLGIGPDEYRRRFALPSPPPSTTDQEHACPRA